MTGSGTRSESESGPEPDGADGDGTGDEGGEGTKRNANVSATIDDPAAEDDDREWRFALDEVGEDAEPQGRPEPEPGSPSLENVAFVVLGIVATLGVVAIVLF